MRMSVCTCMPTKYARQDSDIRFGKIRSMFGIHQQISAVNMFLQKLKLHYRFTPKYASINIFAMQLTLVALFWDSCRSSRVCWYADIVSWTLRCLEGTRLDARPSTVGSESKPPGPRTSPPYRRLSIGLSLLV